MASILVKVIESEMMNRMLEDNGYNIPFILRGMNWFQNKKYVELCEKTGKSPTQRLRIRGWLTANLIIASLVFLINILSQLDVAPSDFGK